MGVKTTAEIASQPAMWRRAVDLGPTVGLPVDGERVAVIGCGTSWFIAQAYAHLRERAGLGATDAYTATEARLWREYDRVVLLSRSGTTTEIREIASATSVPTTMVIDVYGWTIATDVTDTAVRCLADT